MRHFMISCKGEGGSASFACGGRLPSPIINAAMNPIIRPKAVDLPALRKLL